MIIETRNLLLQIRTELVFCLIIHSCFFFFIFYLFDFLIYIYNINMNVFVKFIFKIEFADIFFEY